MNPLARKGDIFSETLPEEVVLYDKVNHKVHCLNKTAAAIWESSDGTRTVDDLANVVKEKFGTEWDSEVVLLALEELDEAGLMEAGRGMISQAGRSRRDALRKIATVAGTACLLPVVSSIVAPTRAAASSGGGGGGGGTGSISRPGEEQGPGNQHSQVYAAAEKVASVQKG